MSNRRTRDRREGDRRADGRVESQAGVRFLKSGTAPQDVLEGQLLDFSRSGLSLLLVAPPAVGDNLLIEVRDAGGHCSSFTAEVVWCEPAEDRRHRVGCTLHVELSRRQRLVLTSLARAARSTLG